MNNTKSLLWLGATAILLASCGNDKQKDAAAAQVPVIDVAQVTVDSVTVHRTYPAYLSASQEVQLVARVNGYLLGSYYKAGDMVRKGQVLYRIESTQYADAVKQASAALANARASYAYASNQYAAMEKALKSDAVSQMEVLQAKSNMETAAAAIKNAQAQLNAAQTRLGYCTVRAPYDGHVSMPVPYDHTYLAGEASPVVLGTIFDDAIMNVNFNVDDSELLRLQHNASNPAFEKDLNSLPVTFDTPLPHNYTAYLTYVAPSINKSTGAMVLQAKIKNEHGDLRSGMFCKVQMPDAVLSKAMLVRDASIGTDQLGKFVYTVNDSNKVVYTPIKVGELVADTMRVVTSGLKPTDRYVTKALLKVRDGMPVQPRLTDTKSINKAKK